MENSNNQASVAVSENTPKSGYYKTAKRKVLDFLLGFLIILVLAILYVYVSSLNLYSVELLLVAIGALLFLSVLFFRIGRKFVVLGMALTLLLPLLIFGGCFFILTQGRF